jgi:hypothetical protein
MLSISEIRSRASGFALRWKDEVSEEAEAKSFWDEFLQVFGVDRRRVASFEKQVAKAGDKAGFIDLFWPGLLIVEHKSAGKNLNKAFTQAIDYFPGLKDVELPRYVIVSDFRRVRLYDLVESTDVEIDITELPDRIDLFGFISGYVPRKFRDEDPVNVRAAELMGRLHDAIKATGYEGHQLEVFLTRLLFCLFGDDTGIFGRDAFVSFLETKTREDGLDVGPQLSFLFQILNTPHKKRPTNLDDELKAFPYVNGRLFAEALATPHFDSEMRGRLLECANFDWTFVSPAVFGAMFQGVMNATERRNLGAHYTSEKNILKVVSGLFLDEVEEELRNAQHSEHRLRALHERIANMRFLDPACGCGNFLIVTYKELRRIEIEILLRLEAMGKLSGKGQIYADVSALSRVSVHAMFGIELEEFPARIAEVALWLIDHIMNVELAKAFGGYFVRLPLTDGPTITIADALDVDWRKDILDTNANAEWFILGNPPFIGFHLMDDPKRKQIQLLFNNAPGAGTLDYVCGWYAKAAIAIEASRIRCAFVSTNSIASGEQVAVLWRKLQHDHDVVIQFAHRTFSWSNEARSVAAVHCVIIGFGCERSSRKRLFEYDHLTSAPSEVAAENINAYLVDGPSVLIGTRRNPLCSVPQMEAGNKPADGGFLVLTEAERLELIELDSNTEKFIRPYMGSREFINGEKRWCLWLEAATPKDLREVKPIAARIEKVREFRLASKKSATRAKANQPWLFDDYRPVPSKYLVVPSVSSERRQYIPIGFVDDGTVPSNAVTIVPHADLFSLAILSSTMHMSWVRYVCGRLKSDYRYSKDLVYNNYPWPEPTDVQREKVESLAQGVLDARANHPTSTLADLYHPTTMPPDLRKAHDALDKAVDQCYRKEPFTSERERVEYLFGLYRKLTEGFGAEEAGRRKGRKKG